MRARPKLVHRLDKDTSGALLVARSARAAGHFAKAFSGRTARKVYWALVVGVPDRDEGEIDAPLAKQPGTGGEKMHISEEHGLPAKTRWRVIDRAGNRAAWVELQPLTGRTHQLRAHMAAIGHPIVGDAKYGGAGGVPDRRDQPQAAPPCAPDPNRCAGRRQDRRDRRSAGAFRGEPRDARLRARWRAMRCRWSKRKAAVTRSQAAQGRGGSEGAAAGTPRRAAGARLAGPEPKRR